MDSIEDLIRLLTLEPLEENIFRGQSVALGSRRVFGGQVLGQAIYAATQTVPTDRLVHSMHGYFVLPGDPDHPIIFNVDRTRDGGSFTTRRVQAIQHGASIFVMAASFQKQEEGFDHQIGMPNVPPPEALRSDHEILASMQDQLPESVRRRLDVPRPVEFRPVESNPFFTPGVQSPFLHIWMRSKGNLPDDPQTHRAILAYASDYNLLMTATRPHPVPVDELMLASLDHAMWFHRAFRMDEWLLLALDSPSASNARGFTRGNIFNRSGQLVASMTQEGLMRKRRKRTD